MVPASRVLVHFSQPTDPWVVPGPWEVSRRHHRFAIGLDGRAVSLVPCSRRASCFVASAVPAILIHQIQRQVELLSAARLLPRRGSVVLVFGKLDDRKTILSGRTRCGNALTRGQSGRWSNPLLLGIWSARSGEPPPLVGAERGCRRFSPFALSGSGPEYSADWHLGGALRLGEVTQARRPPTAPATAR